MSVVEKHSTETSFDLFYALYTFKTGACKDFSQCWGVDQLDDLIPLIFQIWSGRKSDTENNSDLFFTGGYWWPQSSSGANGDDVAALAGSHPARLLSPHLPQQTRTYCARCAYLYALEVPRTNVLMRPVRPFVVVFVAEGLWNWLPFNCLWFYKTA